MSFLTYLRRLRDYLRRLLLGEIHHKPPIEHRPKISILIPFKTDNYERKEAFKWLLKYWTHELPEAEIIVGRSRKKPFCKTEALNDAARRSRGKILVVLDADAYMDGTVIERCADRILEELAEGERLWFVPFRHLYRLNRRITREILASDPTNPLRISTPPPPEDIDNTGQQSGYGHRYGAMVTIFPREALRLLGCFDERFRGWGGEDIALLRALDTLYAKHKTTNNAVFHLWHPVIGHDYKSRVWKGQDKQYNSNLANSYHRATRHPSQMRELVDAGCRKVPAKRKLRENDDE